MSGKSRSCFVPGCSTGYASDRKIMQKLNAKNTSLFGAPKDPKLLKQWQDVIPTTYDRTLRTNHYVCALHFNEEDITRFYETLLPDGSIHRIERGRPMLKPGSVPSIFPDFLPPEYKSKKREESPCDQFDDVLNKKACLDIPMDHIPDTISPSYSELPETTLVYNEVKIETNGDPPSSADDQIKKEKEYLESVENITLSIIPSDSEAADTSTVYKEIEIELTRESLIFQYLKDNIEAICTPSKDWAWSFIARKNEIVFAEWDENYIPMKKIIISDDLSVKVLFGKVQVEIEDKWLCINSSSDLENLIRYIHEKTICSEIDLVSMSEYCKGIATPRKAAYKGRIINRCTACTAMVNQKDNTCYK